MQNFGACRLCELWTWVPVVLWTVTEKKICELSLKKYIFYVNFIKNNPRYESALTKVGNTEQYMRELQQAGYATDPSYAAKVMHIYKSNALNVFADNATTVAVKWNKHRLFNTLRNRLFLCPVEF